MERWRGRVAVVTGAGSGIGAAIAYQLQDAGLTVVGADLHPDKVPGAVGEARKAAEARGRAPQGKAPSPGKLHALKCDVTKEEDILAAFKWVKDNVGGVHVLVNCAGVCGSTNLSETDTDEWRLVLETNVLGLSLCTREAIKLMREKGVDDGHIIHLGSLAGQAIFPVPGLQMYTASKHGVRVLTEGLRKELVAAKSKIRVTEISPGVVKTNIFNRTEGIEKSFKAAAGTDGLWENPHLLPEDVADVTLYAISSPPHVQIHNITVKPVGDLF